MNKSWYHVSFIVQTLEFIRCNSMSMGFSDRLTAETMVSIRNAVAREMKVEPNEIVILTVILLEGEK